MKIKEFPPEEEMVSIGIREERSVIELAVWSIDNTLHTLELFNSANKKYDQDGLLRFRNDLFDLL